MKIYTVILSLAFLLTAIGEDHFRKPIELKDGNIKKNSTESVFHDKILKVRFSTAPCPSMSLQLPENCENYTDIQVDCALSDGFSDNISFCLNDKKGGKIIRHFNVESGDRFSCSIPLDPGQLDKKAMDTMLIYLDQPKRAAEFSFYSAALTSNFPEKFKTLSERALQNGNRKLKERLDLLWEDVKNGRISTEKALKSLPLLEAELSNRKEAIFSATGRLYPNAPFGLAAFSCLEKALPDGHSGIPGETPVKLTLALARNESEMLQLLTIAPAEKPLKNIRIAAGVFSRKGDPDEKLDDLCVAPVGLVQIKSGSGYRRYPDPVCEFTDTVPEVKAGEIQSWVVRCRTTAATRPGIYTGYISLSSEGGKAEIPMEITVYSFSLPQVLSFVTATSVYGSKVLGKHQKELERYILKNYHLNPFSIYSGYAYGVPKLPSIEEYLEARKDGLNFIPIVYLKLPRQAMHSGKSIAPRESKALWDALPRQEQKFYPEEAKQEYLAILRKRIPELKQAGLYDISRCYGFDEAIPSEWEACIDLLKALKAEFPDLKVISTAIDHSYGKDSILNNGLDGWIPQVWRYHFKDAEEARKRGKQVWYYTMSLTIDDFALADIRAQLGSLAFAGKVDGWLVWTVSLWYGNKQPITQVPDTGWNPEDDSANNGRGSYFCMGPNGQILPTLRAEAIRDGIEDYEYFTILKQLAQKRSQDDPLRIKAEEHLNSLPAKFRGTTLTKEVQNRLAAAELIEAMINEGNK